MARKGKHEQKPKLYGTADVALKIGIPEWRVKNFIEGKAYGLSPSHQVGTGRGSRKLYTDQDVLLIAVAYHLVKSGFTPEAVGQALKAMSKAGLIASIVKAIKGKKYRVLIYVDGSWRVSTPGEVLGLVTETVRDRWTPRPTFILNLADFFERYIWRVERE